MTGLVVLLWCIYLSDCFVRQQRGHLTIRAGFRKRMHAVGGPDVELLGERMGFAWTPLLPWRPAYSCGGRDANVKTARRWFDALSRHIRWLNVACAALFVWLLVLLPALVVSGRLLPVLFRWAAVGVVLWILAFALFVRAYRRIRQSSPPFEMWLMMALSPLSLIRAPQAVAFSAVPDLHPVAAAAVLCDESEFLRIARLWYFDNISDQRAITSIVAERGLAGRLLSGPPSWDEGLSQFCPRCHATYLDAATGCRDCHGMTLQPLASR